MSRCQTSLGGQLKYPTAPMAAAAQLHSMVLNHPFHNGNKRTALVAMIVLLDKNGWSLRADEDELFDFVLSVASHEVVDARGEPDKEVEEIAAWIHRHTAPNKMPIPNLKFHDLRSILLKHGCEFGRPARGGNRINISRGENQVQVWYGGDGREVAKNTITEVRRKLKLDEEHGYDPDLFYNAEERLPTFITKYRNILERLAKT